MTTKRTYKSYVLAITSANQEFKGKFELEKTVKRVIGLSMSSSRPDLMIYRGSQYINVGGSEVIPAGYESKMLFPGVNVKPDAKYLTVDELPGNGLVELRYTDANTSNTTFEAYTVTLQLCLDVSR